VFRPASREFLFPTSSRPRQDRFCPGGLGSRELPAVRYTPDIGHRDVADDATHLCDGPLMSKPYRTARWKLDQRLLARSAARG